MVKVLVNKYLVSFRAMLGYAYEDGLHNNDRALSCFSKRKVEESDKAIEIYLREIQLKARFHNPKMDCDCRVEARI